MFVAKIYVNNDQLSTYCEIVKSPDPVFTDPVRQAIAESWPRHMDDSVARREWGWQPAYDLDTMVDDMLDNLSEGS